MSTRSRARFTWSILATAGVAGAGIVVGCGSQESDDSALALQSDTRDDKGEPIDHEVDAGKPATDAGHPSADAGAPTDGGTTIHDSGATTDACVEEQDGGVQRDGGVLPPVGEPDLARYSRQINQLFCQRLASCCGQATFDTLKCLNTFEQPGFIGVGQNGLFAPFQSRGNLSFNPQSAAQCFADINNLGCGPIPASTFTALQADCLGGATGTIPAGATGCLGSAECVPPNHCDLQGGVGTCNPPRPIGAQCSLGFYLPSGDFNPTGNYIEAQAECGFLLSGNPGYCANADTDVGFTTQTNLCAQPRATGTLCYLNTECQSGSCGVSPDPADVAIGAGRCSDTGTIDTPETCAFYRLP
jgi:hypothetical protein